MKQNDFIFADLSTYEVETAKKFYSNVFGWEYKTQDGEYFVAYDGDKEVSGLYETPQKFQDMNMPSFWMTYIQVDSVDETVEKAKKLGAIIEMTENQQGFGKVALIRDPLGSGFTIYEGENLDSRNFNTSNTLVWNELFISDISKVKDFYTGIFDWNIQENNRGNWSILNGDDKEIGAITELDEAERSKYQYWGSVFLVENREETKKKVLENGGAVVFETDDLSCFTDFSGTAFFYLVEK